MKKLLMISIMILHAAAASAQGMSVYTHKKLQTIETYIAENNLEKAEAAISKLLSDLPRHDEDRAYTFYTTGMFYLQTSDYKTARKYFLAAHQLDCFPEETRLYLLQTIAGLFMQDEDYSRAEMFYKDYMALAPSPGKDIYLGLGSAYFFQKKYAATIALLEKAVDQLDPKETIYLMLFSSYYESRQPQSAIRILENMIRLWPGKKKYWIQLAALYIEQKSYDKSVEIMQAAMARNYLIKEKDLLQYVYMLYEIRLPYKAAVILEKAMDQAIVENTKKHFELLSTLYQEAKERREAIAALEKAAELSTDGKNHLYIAQLYFEMAEDGEFPRVIEHARKAIENGINQNGDAHMLMAAAYVELEDIENARKSLGSAAQHEKTRKSAMQWLVSLE